MRVHLTGDSGRGQVLQLEDRVMRHPGGPGRAEERSEDLWPALTQLEEIRHPAGWLPIGLELDGPDPCSQERREAGGFDVQTHPLRRVVLPLLHQVLEIGEALEHGDHHRLWSGEIPKRGGSYHRRRFAAPLPLSGSDLGRYQLQEAPLVLLLGGLRDVRGSLGDILQGGRGRWLWSRFWRPGSGFPSEPGQQSLEVLTSHGWRPPALHGPAPAAAGRWRGVSGRGSRPPHQHVLPGS